MKKIILLRGCALRFISFRTYGLFLFFWWGFLSTLVRVRCPGCCGHRRSWFSFSLPRVSTLTKVPRLDFLCFVVRFLTLVRSDLQPLVVFFASEDLSASGSARTARSGCHASASCSTAGDAARSCFTVAAFASFRLAAVASSLCPKLIVLVRHRHGFSVSPLHTWSARLVPLSLSPR
jgi:hypothetical protein